METVLKPFLEILREIYIGKIAEHTWVIDPQPGEGFTAAIHQLSAAQASTPIVPGGTTIAAHTEHLRWSLYFALEFFEGRTPSSKWEESWRIREVDQQQWEKLQQDLREAYDKVNNAVASVKDWSNDFLVQGTLALLPHAAYHLGAVKQLITFVRND
jgi:hypothetical protein